MKKALKGLGYFVLVAIVLTGALAVYVAITGIPRYAPGNVNLKVETSAAKVEGGRKYASMLCVGCHLDPSTGKLTGKRLADVPTVFGTGFQRTSRGIRYMESVLGAMGNSHISCARESRAQDDMLPHGCRNILTCRTMT